MKRHRSLSPFSSKTEDDVNAAASLPPIISYLSFVVKRAKTEHDDFSDYQMRPRTMELRFAERYIGPSDMEPVDVEKVCLSMHMFIGLLTNIVLGQKSS
jgi:hypothetical protein